MKIIEQSHEILSLPENLLQMIEAAGRTCYKSEDKITHDSATGFVSRMRDRGHHAMLEFGDITVKFITNRGVTHELVRHRLFSFAQESSRYVRYDGSMEFIRPVWCCHELCGDWERDFPKNLSKPEYDFFTNCLVSESTYQRLLTTGWRPEQAREVLPNSLKTEIVVKGNIREWRHCLTLRTSKKAHPQIRSLLTPLLKELQQKIPILFDDIKET
jgi:thymidylate synthase (FAD)